MTLDPHVIVIGASAGGIEALKKVVSDLPEDFPGAILIVLHVAPHGLNLLDRILAKSGPLPAKIAVNGDRIKAGQIFIAPADHHLLVQDTGRLVTTRGPKENRSRPAIDPLFRSAAVAFGPRVIGVILTGYLDDGTAGLGAIRDQGGITVVQNPEEAFAPSMPTSAVKHVEVNYIVHLEEIGRLLVRLVEQPAKSTGGVPVNKKMEIELKIAGEADALGAGITELGSPSNFACPDCHGVLLQIKEGSNLRFRCHTGHAYALQTLLVEFEEKTETALWTALRSVDETILLLGRMAPVPDGNGELDGAQVLRKKIDQAKTRSRKIRQAMTATLPTTVEP